LAKTLQWLVVIVIMNALSNTKFFTTIVLIIFPDDAGTAVVICAVTALMAMSMFTKGSPIMNVILAVTITPMNPTLLV